MCLPGPVRLCYVTQHRTVVYSAWYVVCTCTVCKHLVLTTSVLESSSATSAAQLSAARLSLPVRLAGTSVCRSLRIKVLLRVYCVFQAGR
jgi:hypothetical protein